MPTTIDVPVTLVEKVWTVAQLARELGMKDRSNCQRYVNRLADYGHSHFRDYQKGEPLTEQQKNVLVEYRRLSTVEGKRGDGLWRAIKDYPRSPTDVESELIEVCDRYGVRADLIAHMVQDVMEIFTSEA